MIDLYYLSSINQKLWKPNQLGPWKETFPLLNIFSLVLVGIFIIYVDVAYPPWNILKELHGQLQPGNFLSQSQRKRESKSRCGLSSGKGKGKGKTQFHYKTQTLSSCFTSVSHWIDSQKLFSTHFSSLRFLFFLSLFSFRPHLLLLLPFLLQNFCRIVKTLFLLLFESASLIPDNVRDFVSWTNVRIRS